jgi:O-6-methylguanine DNA methyltransferase
MNTLKVSKDGIGIEADIENGVIYAIKVYNRNIGESYSEADKGIYMAFREYLDGVSPNFNLKLNTGGLTGFQRKVYAEISEIPAGCVSTYGKIAQSIGNRNLSRAVGGALARNPFPIVIPCHRIVGAKGLCGFSADGGIETKAKLIALEKRLYNPQT